MSHTNIQKKLKQIEKTFLEEREINLGKQCKGEYIVYNFYNITTDNTTVKRMCKEHYADSSCKTIKKSSKHTLINKSLREVIDNDIYDLLCRGYELIDFLNI